MDLRTDLDRELASTPPDPFDLEATLARGRRAARVRRAAYSLAGASAAAALVGGFLWVVTPAEKPTTQAPPASVGRQGAGAESRLPHGQVAGLDHRTGALEVRDGWSIVEQVDDPIALGAPEERSVALELTNGTDVEWVLSRYTFEEGGSTFTQNDDAADYPASWTLEQWLEVHRSLWLGTPTDLLAAFGPNGQLVASEGWTIKQQRSGLDLGRDFRGPEGIAAVMELSGPTDGWYLVRPTGDLAAAYPVLFPYAETIKKFPGTVDGFLDYVGSSAYRSDAQGFLGDN